MKVKHFIIKNGIEKLNGCKIWANEKFYTIKISEEDIFSHSLKNEEWKNSIERLNKYHEKGNYRFIAVSPENTSIWVSPSDEVIIDDVFSFQEKEYISGGHYHKLHFDYYALRGQVSSLYEITVDNSRSESWNINICRPTFVCIAINKAEAVGLMALSDWSYKHLPILSISAT